MHILFVSSEVFPYAKTGGLADVCGALPIALEKLGCKVSVFMPHYNHIEKDGRPFKIIGHELTKSSIGKDIDVYLIANHHFYHRGQLYGDEAGDYKDNLQRFSFFDEQVLKVIKELGIKADVVHCHDWQSALIPVLLKERYQKDSALKKIRSVLTLHNMAYQGVFPKEQFPLLGLPEKLFSINGFEYFGQINLLKAGIIYSDRVTTVSRQYAKEITTSELGFGLEGVLRQYHKKIEGIVNGIDYDVWDPATDKYIAQRFSAEKYKEGKESNKVALQAKLGLPPKEGTAVLGFVGRLSHQKGLDVILESFKELMAMDVQLVLQGEGDARYAKKLKAAAREYPQKFAAHLDYSEPLAHMIYAGADMLLMPSTFEPCGLSQMISMRYGTVPVVFKTGGLVDTVVPLDDDPVKGNGFMFAKMDKKSFIHCVTKAIKSYRDQNVFAKAVLNGMAADFSWDSSAVKYKELYQCLLSA